MTDENTNPEENLEDAPLASEQNTDVGSEPAETPSEGSVPYARFQEVNQEKNDLREEIGAMKGELETLKEPESEPEDWQEAEKRTVDKATAQMRNELKAEAQKNQTEEMEIEKGFSQLKQMGQEVSDNVKKAVLEKMIETGGDVFGTYLEIKGTLDGQAKTDQIKTEGQIPTSQKGSEANAHGIPYDQLKKMSIDDIVERAKT